jgi:hypothetical protein
MIVPEDKVSTLHAHYLYIFLHLYPTFRSRSQRNREFSLEGVPVVHDTAGESQQDKEFLIIGTLIAEYRLKLFLIISSFSPFQPLVTTVIRTVKTHSIAVSRKGEARVRSAKKQWRNLNQLFYL